jgi:hypothetical protein
VAPITGFGPSWSPSGGAISCDRNFSAWMAVFRATNLGKFLILNWPNGTRRTMRLAVSLSQYLRRFKYRGKLARLPRTTAVHMCTGQRSPMALRTFRSRLLVWVEAKYIDMKADTIQIWSFDQFWNQMNTFVTARGRDVQPRYHSWLSGPPALPRLVNKTSLWTSGWKQFSQNISPRFLQDEIRPRCTGITFKPSILQAVSSKTGKLAMNDHGIPTLT